MPPEPRRLLLDAYAAALAAVDGARCVREYLRAHPLEAPVALIAIGKAACAMARGARAELGAVIGDALVVTRPGHVEPPPWPVWEAGHPVPDDRSIAAGARLLEFIAALPAQARVLVLLSGGASSLLEVLPTAVTPGRLQKINRWLLGSGLDIRTMNAVRKRLSRIKGGRLARLLYPRTVLCLAISDVPGDDPRVIGSGPVVADSAPAESPNPDGLPDFVVEAVRHAPPAPPPDDCCFKNVTFAIVATLADAKRAAADRTETLGVRAVSEPDFIGGDAAAAGARLAQRLLESAPGVVHVWGGETTVRLPQRPGRGGRNQSLALAAALALRGRDNVWLLSAGTDGSDGSSDDAGALVDGGTCARGEQTGLDAARCLAGADAGRFLEASGDLIHTGPTGTNVMDLMLGLRL